MKKSISGYRQVAIRLDLHAAQLQLRARVGTKRHAPPQQYYYFAPAVRSENVIADSRYNFSTTAIRMRHDRWTHWMDGVRCLYRFLC